MILNLGSGYGGGECESRSRISHVVYGVRRCTFCVRFMPRVQRRVKHRGMLVRAIGRHRCQVFLNAGHNRCKCQYLFAYWGTSVPSVTTLNTFQCCGRWYLFSEKRCRKEFGHGKTIEIRGRITGKSVTRTECEY